MSIPAPSVFSVLCVKKPTTPATIAATIFGSDANAGSPGGAATTIGSTSAVSIAAGT